MDMVLLVDAGIQLTILVPSIVKIPPWPKYNGFVAPIIDWISLSPQFVPAWP